LDFDEADRRRVLFRYDGIFEHAAIRCNYTTYDVRRAQDTINPSSSHADIMVLARKNNRDEEEHPFWYARVLRVFHANVLPFTIKGKAGLSKETRMDFLWVHWFSVDSQSSGLAGFAEQRLDQVTLLDAEDPNAFGFVDPKEVIRGCHLIPAFSQLPSEEILGRAALASTTNDSLSSFYVSRLVVVQVRSFLREVLT
jgi:hypothetical protein